MKQDGTLWDLSTWSRWMRDDFVLYWKSLRTDVVEKPIDVILEIFMNERKDGMQHECDHVGKNIFVTGIVAQSIGA